MLAEIFLAIPNVASPATPRWHHYDFASERTFKAPMLTRDEAAGGEVAVVPLRCICGQAAVSVAWATQPAARPRVGDSRVPSFGGSRARGISEMQSGALDTARVRDHVRKEDLDPNAPEDVPLLALLKRAEHGGVGGAFRAFRLGRELQLIKSWLQTDRLRLLQLRRERPHEWQTLPSHARAVPQRDAEIPPRMRELLQRGGPAPSAADDDGFDSTRQQSKIRAWVSQVLTRQQRAQNSSVYLMTTADVVKEPLLEMVRLAELTCSLQQHTVGQPHLPYPLQEVEAFDCNSFLEKLFAPRRKLKPRLKPRKPEPGSAEVSRQLEIVVVEGVDLPIRQGDDATKTRLCVECTFQSQTFMTDVKAGPNPIWNQRVNLNLTAPNGDWSQRALMNMSADITFNLFDRVQKTYRNERETNGATPSYGCTPLAMTVVRAHRAHRSEDSARGATLARKLHRAIFYIVSQWRGQRRVSSTHAAHFTRLRQGRSFRVEAACPQRCIATLHHGE